MRANLYNYHRLAIHFLDFILYSLFPSCPIFWKAKATMDISFIHFAKNWMEKLGIFIIYLQKNIISLNILFSPGKKKIEEEIKLPRY
jgi:hypothetical protein